MWFAAGAIELNRLLLLQKRAFRIICGAPQLSHSMPLALQLNILPLHEYITFSVRLFTFNIYHNILQISVHILFTNLSHLYNYSRLRHSLYNFVAIRCNTSKCQSFILYIKVFVVLCRYVWSGLIVVLGIYLNIYNKNKAKWNASILYYINQFSFNSLKLFAARHGRMSVNREHIV